jgi:GNAT superfamily N-acetyltransferase
MAFKILEVTSPTEFDQIWPIHFQSFRTPYNTLSKFFNPVHTTLEAAIETSKARHIKMWEGNPACHWIKAVSAESGKVVGAACWLINLEVQKLDQKKGPFNAHWHIEGSDEKAFAERLIGGLRGFVAERVTRPHVGENFLSGLGISSSRSSELGQMIVHPDYRRHGVGRMLIEWGTRKADELGVETIVVSVPFAAPVYEKTGFGRIERIDIDFDVAEPSEKWKEYQAEDLRTFLMWRPAGRDYQSGDRVPWDGGN